MAMSKTAATGTAVDKAQKASDKAARASLKSLVNKYGLRAVSQRIGLHRETILAVIAGVDVRAGTLVLVREKLRAHAPS